MRVKNFRSLLFLPALSPHFLTKAHERGADVLLIDLEDSIIAERKDEARAAVPKIAQELHARGAIVGVRVNPTKECWKKDLLCLDLSFISLIMLPKVESATDVIELANEIDEMTANHSYKKNVNIAALIETPLGVMNAMTIACASPRLSALGFGAEDYCTSLGIDPHLETLTWPAQMVTTSAHAHGLQCWGLPATVAEISDLKNYEKNVATALRLGFTGSVAIHPKQVPILNEGFSPSDAQIKWAKQVIESYQHSKSSGEGVAVVEGKMIDSPIVARAQLYLSRF